MCVIFDIYKVRMDMVELGLVRNATLVQATSLVDNVEVQLWR